MKYLYALPLFLLTACAKDTLSTGQDFFVDVVGTERAYCTLSTPYNRYLVHAPAGTYVERGETPLKVDCKDDYSDRRRTVMVAPEFSIGYWTYPSKITVDFATMPDEGTIMKGYRIEGNESSVTEILTEDSYSEPVMDAPIVMEDVQDVEVIVEPEDLLIETTVFEEMVIEDLSEIPTSTSETYQGRRSYPIPLD